MDGTSSPHQPRSSARLYGQYLSSQLIYLPAILFVGWRLLTPATKQTQSNAIIEHRLQGTVTKADRLPSWLRERAIDELPLYSSYGKGADGDSDALDDFRSWAINVGNNNHPGEPHTETLVVDMILIGSTDRIEHRTSQRDISGSGAHGRFFVRDVLIATGETVDKTMVLVNDSVAINVSPSNRSCQGVLRTCAPSTLIQEDELCLQRRLGLAVGAFCRRYRKIVNTVSITMRKEKSMTTASNFSTSDSVADWIRLADRVLPDFLIVSFDVLSHNTSLYEECLSSYNSTFPLVLAPAVLLFEGNGSHVKDSTNQESTSLSFTLPAERSGAVFNHAALEKFARPIACYGVNHDPRTEELEYNFCRWLVSRAANIFDYLLHQALVLWQKAIPGERSKYVSISDLFSAYSSTMHLICERHKVVPTGEEVLGYLIYRFRVSEYTLENGQLMPEASNKPPAVLRCDRLTSNEKEEHSNDLTN